MAKEPANFWGELSGSWWKKLTGSCTEKGHIRIMTRGTWRKWYAHRLVVHLLIQVWNPFGWEGIPQGWAVHHINFQKRDNCPYNLLLLDPLIHNYLTEDGQPRGAGGFFSSRRKGKEGVLTGDEDLSDL